MSTRAISATTSMRFIGVFQRQLLFLIFNHDCIAKVSDFDCYDLPMFYSMFN